MAKQVNTNIPERIVTAWFCNFEPTVHAAFLKYGNHNDWYDAERAAAIEDECELCWFNKTSSWRKAYFAAVSYCFHDEKNPHRPDAYGCKDIAGPFLTAKEAMAVAEEKFADAVETFR